jgi:hypothetical protein
MTTPARLSQAAARETFGHGGEPLELAELGIGNIPSQRAADRSIDLVGHAAFFSHRRRSQENARLSARCR